LSPEKFCAKICWQDCFQSTKQVSVIYPEGQTFGRPRGSRNRRTKEIFDRLEERGDLDPADLLSPIVTNTEEPKELRIQAAGMLMPKRAVQC
jgi:hypothetical protein